MKRILFYLVISMICSLYGKAMDQNDIKVRLCDLNTPINAQHYLPKKALHFWDYEKNATDSLRVVSNTDVSMLRDSAVYIDKSGYTILNFIITHGSTTATIEVFHQSPDSLVFGFQSNEKWLGDNKFTYSFTNFEMDKGFELPVRYQNGTYSAILKPLPHFDYVGLAFIDGCSAKSSSQYYNPMTTRQQIDDKLFITVQIPSNGTSIELLKDSINFHAASIINTQTFTDVSSKINIASKEYKDTLTGLQQNTMYQLKIHLSNGGYVLSDTMGYWVNKLAYTTQADIAKLPYRLSFNDASTNFTSIQWMFPDAKIVKGNDYDLKVDVEFAKPGYYDVIMKGLYGDDMFDSLRFNNAVMIPGIATRGERDTITVCNGRSVELSGYKIERWSDSTNLRTLQSGTDKIEIIPTKSQWYFANVFDVYTDSYFKDSVFINIISSLSSSELITDTVCAWTKMAKLKLGSIDSLWIESNTIGTMYSAKKDLYIVKDSTITAPYFLKSCRFESKFTLKRINYDSATLYNIYPQTICRGEGTTISASGYPLPTYYKWEQGGKAISDSSTMKAYEIGTYNLTYGTHVECPQHRTFTISYSEAAHDSITSINYLPGIGYVSTFLSENVGHMAYNNQKTIIRAYQGQNDTILSISGESAMYSFEKTKLLLDTTQYRTANFQKDSLSYIIVNSNREYSSCKSSTITIKSGNPFQLKVRKTLEGDNALEWTAYSVSSYDSIYIFRGDSIDNMRIWQTVSKNISNIKDEAPTKNYVYAVGIVDKYKGYEVYGSMLYNWQKGFITSNLSPINDDFKRIGIFAAYQNVAPKEEVFLRALAPGANNYKWKVQNDTGYVSGEDSIFRIMYPKPGKYSVKLSIERNGALDSLVMDSFITVHPRPVKLIVDTIFAQSTDTVKFVLSDLLVSRTANKIYSYFDYNTFNDSSLYSHRSIWNMQNDSYTEYFLFKNILKDTCLPKFKIKMGTDSAFLVIKVTAATNQAPKFKQVPTQIANIGWLFSPLVLFEYVSDDYTMPNKLKFNVLENPTLSGLVTNGVLRVWQTDLNWIGETELKIVVSDQSDAKDTLRIRFIQPTLVKVPEKKPTAEFRSNKVIIMLGDTVVFTPTMKYADSVIWTISGTNTVTSKEINPSICFTYPGKYTVSLKAINYHGDVVYTRENYISVLSTITPRNQAVCAGTALKFAINAAYKSYKWSTGETSTEITVSPKITTTYKVTLTVNAIVKVYDSVTVYIPQAANLGADTIACANTPMTLNAGVFKEYYWNGSAEKGNNVLAVNKSGTYTVRTIDTANCESKDTVKVTINALPTINLGADTTFCWKKSKTISAPPSKEYLWSNNTTKQQITVDTSGVWSVTITDNNGCQNSDTLTTTVRVPFVEQIGIVTQSERLYDGKTKNLIAWKQTTNKDVEKYIVYREGASKFDAFDSIKVGDSTKVIDLLSQPNAKSYKYALKTKDVCGNYSTLSTPHSTMYLACFLQRATNDSTVSVEWTQYNGLNIKEYIIYRAKKGATLEYYQTVPKTNETKMVWIDKTPLGLNSYYRVGFAIDELKIDKMKSDTGPFSQSLSNMSEVSLVDEPTIESANQAIHVYPNPVIDNITIDILAQDAKYIVIENLLGQEITRREAKSTARINISLSDYPQGMYIVKVVSKEQTYCSKIHKQ